MNVFTDIYLGRYLSTFMYLEDLDILKRLNHSYYNGIKKELKKRDFDIKLFNKYYIPLMNAKKTLLLLIKPDVIHYLQETQLNYKTLKLLTKIFFYYEILIFSSIKYLDFIILLYEKVIEYILADDNWPPRFIYKFNIFSKLKKIDEKYLQKCPEKYKIRIQNIKQYVNNLNL
jgi:hypothetical protein